MSGTAKVSAAQHATPNASLLLHLAFGATAAPAPSLERTWSAVRANPAHSLSHKRASRLGLQRCRPRRAAVASPGARAGEVDPAPRVGHQVTHASFHAGVELAWPRIAVLTMRSLAASSRLPGQVRRQDRHESRRLGSHGRAGQAVAHEQARQATGHACEGQRPHAHRRRHWSQTEK